MSGNTLLKFLAEVADADLPLQGAVAQNQVFSFDVAVNPAVDLPVCMRALERPCNFIYHRRFTHLVIEQRLANEPPETVCFLRDKFSKTKSIREFDNLVTAPSWGFENAEHYYRSQSAISLLDRIRLPLVILTADDDPLVPFSIFRKAALSSHTELVTTRGGGHMGYLSSPKTPFGDRRFEDFFIVKAAEHLFGRDGI